jgi:putative FmdB family regulatory protein
MMPIFAYRCRSCDEEFQTLVMPGETPICRSCESANLEQQLSLIASPNKGGGAGSDVDFGPCSTGMCCGGACDFADAR